MTPHIVRLIVIGIMHGQERTVRKAQRFKHKVRHSLLLLCCPVSQCVCMGLRNLMTQVFSHIINLLHPHQNGCDFHQFLILHVINESADGDCIFRLEDIRMR